MVGSLRVWVSVHVVSACHSTPFREDPPNMLSLTLPELPCGSCVKHYPLTSFPTRVECVVRPGGSGAWGLASGEIVRSRGAGRVCDLIRVLSQE